MGFMQLENVLQRIVSHPIWLVVAAHTVDTKMLQRRQLFFLAK